MLPKIVSSPIPLFVLYVTNPSSPEAGYNQGLMGVGYEADLESPPEVGEVRPSHLVHWESALVRMATLAQRPFLSGPLSSAPSPPLPYITYPYKGPN